MSTSSPGPAQRQDGRGDGLGGARGDQHLAVGVPAQAVAALLVLGDRLPQRQDARAGRVLVGARGDRVRGGPCDGDGAVDVGEALAEVDGAGAGGEHGHLGEDGGPGDAVVAHQPGRAGDVLPAGGGHG